MAATWRNTDPNSVLAAIGNPQVGITQVLGGDIEQQAQPTAAPDETAKAIRQYRARKAQRGNKVERHGIEFDSKDEADRYDVLLVWQEAGIIEGLLHHKSVRVMDGFDHPSFGHVVARNWEFDFIYTQRQKPFLRVYEDFKGRETDAWKAMLGYRLYFLRDLHVFVNRAKSGWYRPVIAD